MNNRKTRQNEVSAKEKVVSPSITVADGVLDDAEHRVQGAGSEAPGDELNIDEVTQPEEPLSAPLPTDCGDYEIVSCLGSGGMGKVYKAKHRHLDKMFAVKVVHHELVSDESAVSRFEREAVAASDLTHANLVAIFDHGKTTAGSPFLVMELIEGKALADIIREEGFLDEKRALNIFIEIAEAVNHAHYKNVIHRDLKPSNVLVTSTANGAEMIKVLDFGIAKILGDDSASPSSTQTGEVFGSPSYMSPEQCLGNPVDRRSDVYSLGCIMYEALTGRPPFAGENPIQTILMQVNDNPPPFEKTAADLKISSDLRSVVLSCLNKNVAERYQSMEELIADLRRVADGLPIKRKQVRRASRAGTVLDTLLFLVAAFISMATGYILGNGVSPLPPLGNITQNLSAGSVKPVAPPSELKKITILNRHKKVLFATQATNLQAALNEAMREGVDLSGADLAGREFKSVNFYGKFNNANFGHCKFDTCTFGNSLQLQGANFSHSLLKDCWFSFCNLNYSNFHAVKAVPGMHAAEFSANRIVKADFSNAVLPGAKFDQSTLMETNFRNADLTHGMFWFTSCVGADFRGAKLDQSEFPSAVLTNARFDGTPPSTGQN